MKVLDDSKYPAATYIFLGFVVWEFERQAAGLILVPAANDTF